MVQISMFSENENGSCQFNLTHLNSWKIRSYVAGMRFFRFLADFRFFHSNFNFKSCWISSESYKSTVLGRRVGEFQTFYGLFQISDCFIQSSVSCLMLSYTCVEHMYWLYYRHMMTLDYMAAILGDLLAVFLGLTSTNSRNAKSVF